MFYHLFTYLDKFDIPGAGLFYYISFRSALAVLLALTITLLFGKKLINILRKNQIKEDIRNLGLEGENQKKGTPTMGGLIIIAGILFPVIFFCNLKNIYVQLMLITTIWLGFIGFLDDYIKVYKKDKNGLNAKFKVYGQIILGIIIGLTVHFNKNIVIREKQIIKTSFSFSDTKESSSSSSKTYIVKDVKSTKVNIPFLKNNEFDYSVFLSFLGEKAKKYTWIVYTIIVIFIISAVSNGANLTDGLDGLAAGTSAIIGTTLGVLAYVSGNSIIADYLNIMYIPNTGELVIFMSAFVGSLIGFLWYNSYPAQVFMGDIGSLTIGGIIAVYSLLIRKELLLPILCGIFFAESLSVIIQVSYFKYTRKKYGEGKRIFKMAPLHHHYQMLKYPEPKIVTRFWIIGIFLAVITIITLKIR